MLEVIKNLFLAGLFVLTITALYFVAIEQWRRHKCKIGQHAGHIKDGKLICHTCFSEIDHKG